MAFHGAKAQDAGTVAAVLSAVLSASPEEGVRTMAAVLLRQIAADRAQWLGLPAAAQATVTQNIVARSVGPPPPPPRVHAGARKAPRSSSSPACVCLA